MIKKVIFTKDHQAFFVEGQEAQLYLNGESLTEEIDVSLASDKDWDNIKKNPWNKKELMKFSNLPLKTK